MFLAMVESCVMGREERIETYEVEAFYLLRDTIDEGHVGYASCVRALSIVETGIQVDPFRLQMLCVVSSYSL